MRDGVDDGAAEAHHVVGLVGHEGTRRVLTPVPRGAQPGVASLGRVPDADPHRLPRTVVPSRYDLTLAPTSTRPRSRARSASTSTSTEPATEVVLNAIELEIDEASVVVDGERRDAERRASTRTTERLTPDLSPRRLPEGDAVVDARLPRDPQRQAPRLLPQHVHRRGRRGADPGHHPVRGHRRPPGVPLLGRARPQGHLRGDPRGARRPAGHLQRRGGGPPDRSRTAASGSTSPRRWSCRPTWWPSSSARSRPPSP